MSVLARRLVVGHMRAVGVAGVDVGDAEFHGTAQHGERGGVVTRRVPHPRAGQLHRPIPEPPAGRPVTQSQDAAGEAVRTSGIVK